MPEEQTPTPPDASDKVTTRPVQQCAGKPVFCAVSGKSMRYIAADDVVVAGKIARLKFGPKWKVGVPKNGVRRGSFVVLQVPVPSVAAEAKVSAKDKAELERRGDVNYVEIRVQ